MKPTLFILCGLPFSGKTTLAKALIQKYGWEFVGLDEINRERGIGIDVSKAITPKEWDISYQLTFTRTAKLLSDGKTVIYDATNFTKEQRRKLVTIAENHGASAKIIYVDTPKAEVIKRWMENKEKTQRNDVREEDFMQVVNNFEAPSPEEHAIAFHNGDAIEKVV